MLTDAAPISHAPARSVRAGVVLAALGVVFGDIGTSPRYSMQTLFHPAAPRPGVRHTSVIGLSPGMRDETSRGGRS